MRDLGDHAPRLLRIRPLGNAMQFAEAQSLQRFAHADGAADSAVDLTDAKSLHSALCRAHAPAPSPSSPLRPRSDLYSFSLRSCLNASKVALTTLCGFAVPSDLVRMF